MEGRRIFGSQEPTVQIDQISTKDLWDTLDNVFLRYLTLNLKINRIARFLTFERKYESVKLSRRKLLIYNVSELHLYEIFKTATKIIRSENSVPCLEKLISED